MEEVRIRTFLSEFDAQEAEIEQIYRRLATKAERIDRQGATEEATESIGYWLHNLYSAYEDLFKLVAGFWENHVSGDGGYHVSLLRRMRVAVEGVRPALVTEDATLRHATSTNCEASGTSFATPTCTDSMTKEWLV